MAQTSRTFFPWDICGDNWTFTVKSIMWTGLRILSRLTGKMPISALIMATPTAGIIWCQRSTRMEWSLVDKFTAGGTRNGVKVLILSPHWTTSSTCTMNCLKTITHFQSISSTEAPTLAWLQGLTTSTTAKQILPGLSQVMTTNRPSRKMATLLKSTWSSGNLFKAISLINCRLYHRRFPVWKLITSLLINRAHWWILWKTPIYQSLKRISKNFSHKS